MIASFVRRAPRLLACAALFSAAAAYGQTATVVVQGFSAGAACTSFVLGGSASAPTLTCNAGGGSAFSCSANASPASISSGGSSTLTMNCSGGTGPYSYSLAGGPQGQSGNQFVVGPTVTTQYSITATDSAQGTAQKTPTVTVSPGGGGGGGGPISCPGYANTQTANVAWSTGASAVIPAGEADAIVITFTPLGEIGTPGSKITAFEFGSAPAGRFAVLSTTPCDFAYQPAELGIYAAQSGTTVTQKMNLPGELRPKPLRSLPAPSTTGISRWRLVRAAATAR